MSSGQVKYTVLATAPNQASKVLLYETAYGTCVLKRWLKDRVAIGGNRSQPLAEYSALLDLQCLPNINAPVRITLDRDGVDFIYVHCGQNALDWRAKLVHEDEINKEQVAEQLAQHVAVHVLCALQEFESRGLVHRDVKPSNILIRDYPTGGTWLSDMGLTTRAKELSGFVKGLDTQYIPPEYISYGVPTQQQQQQPQEQQQQEQWHITDDLAALAAVTTPAADMYQLGLTIYQLVTGSLPQPLQPPKHNNLKRFSSFLQRVATFNWPREISRQISNPKVAEVLNALLSSNPESRPSPARALAAFEWLQEGVALAGQQQPSIGNLERESAWAAEQQQALKAAQYIDFLRLQEEFAGPVHSTAAAPGVSSHSQQLALSGHPMQDSGYSSYNSYSSLNSTPYATPRATPYPSPAAVQPTISAEDSFAGLPVAAAAAAGNPGKWGDLAQASAAAAAAADKQSKQRSSWESSSSTAAAAAQPTDRAASASGYSSWGSTPITSPAALQPTVSAEDSFASVNAPGTGQSGQVKHSSAAEPAGSSSSSWAAVASRSRSQPSIQRQRRSSKDAEQQRLQQHEGW